VQADLLMDDVVIEHNVAMNDGGGISCAEGNVEMVNSEVNHNAVLGYYENGADGQNLVAGSRGGGLFLQSYSSLTASNSNVSGNIAHDSGAGMYLKGEIIVVLNGCEISDNEAGTVGAGIFAQDSVSFKLLAGTRISRNSIMLVDSCDGQCGDGAGMYLDSNCDVEMVDSGFYENTATDEGGAFYVKQNSVVRLTRSEIVDNVAAYYGGEGCVKLSSFFAHNSTISGNACNLKGGRGAGMYGDNHAIFHFTQSLFVDNEARGGSGAGILLSSFSTSVPTPPSPSPLASPCSIEGWLRGHAWPCMAFPLCVLKAMSDLLCR